MLHHKASLSSSPSFTSSTTLQARFTRSTIFKPKPSKCLHKIHQVYLQQKEVNCSIAKGKRSDVNLMENAVVSADSCLCLVSRIVMFETLAVSASSDHVNAGAIENGNEGSSKPPSGSKEMYRPRSVPKSILEWYGYASVADYHADADYVPKKKVKSPGPIAVLGLPNKVTWMDMVKKMGIRGAGITGKGKGKV
ncbi:hypothetical protein Tco_1216430 [Tanacetum coccineum]